MNVALGVPLGLVVLASVVALSGVIAAVYLAIRLNSRR
jgi:hypothetical protein